MRWFLGTLSVACFFATHVERGFADPILPTDPGAWVNSRPLSLDALEGKTVVFYFFEESCPTCLEKWPPLLETSAKFQGEPVVFIGVNSGNQRRTVESYARKARIPWPIIVDTNRSLEQAFQLPKPVSLENIYQMKVKYPDGAIRSGSPNNFEETITSALKNASWKIDPKTLPPETLAAWKEVELGDYQRALPLLKKILAAQSDEISQAADQLQSLVMDNLEKQQTAASQAEEEGKIWVAYQIYSRIAAQFKGYEGADVAVEKSREYARHDDVKTQQAAFKKLGLAQKYGARGDERSVKRAIAMLEQLIEDYPDTDAAKRAQDILAVVNVNPAVP